MVKIRMPQEFADQTPDASILATEAAMNTTRTADMLSDRIGRLLRPLGVSWAGGLVLGALGDHGPMPPSELGERLNVTRATVTGLLDSLQRRRLVARSANPADRRSLLVEITPEGTTVLRELRMVVHRQEKAWLGVLSDPELRTYVELLHRIQDGLEASPAADDVAPDGSPVAFYRRLPAMGEPELIHVAIGAAASVLDLGCGPGRIAGPLAALGHPVVGVDDGAGMIVALPAGVEGVVADARTVRLGRTFGAVLLASHLVNATDDGPAFAATAAAHLDVGGLVVGETYPPGWDPTPTVGREQRLGDARIVLLRAEIAGDLLRAEVRYGVDGNSWSQAFSARLLDEPALHSLLEGAGLAFVRWLERPGWFVARRER
jgi:DNA-binding MarR family transcriptional regulator